MVSLPLLALAVFTTAAAARPAAAGAEGLSVEPCRPALENQSWSLAGGALELAGSGLCAEYSGDGVPLVLSSCNSSSPAQRWAWVEAHGALELAHPPGSGSTAPACADVRWKPGNGGQPGDVGGYFPCHYAAGLPPHNEGWARGAGGRITSTCANPGGGSGWNGWCLTAPGPPPPPPPDLQSGLNVWPIPRGEERASGPPLPLAPGFAVRYTGNSTVAKAAAARYTSLIRSKAAVAAESRYRSSSSSNGGALAALELVLASDDDTFTSWTVNESYSLSVRGGSATVRAQTPFGGLRGLETFFQLLPNATTANPRGTEVPSAFALPHDTIAIADEPSYPWRSLMIDTGAKKTPFLSHFFT